jgi:hypothetical protein
VVQHLELTNVARLQLAILTRRDVKLDTRVLIKGFEALGLDFGIMNKQVIPVLARYETISFVLIEPLNSTFSHILPFFLPQEAYPYDVVYNQEIHATPYEPFRLKESLPYCY